MRMMLMLLVTLFKRMLFPMASYLRFRRAMSVCVADRYRTYESASAFVCPFGAPMMMRGISVRRLKKGGPLE